MVELSGYTGRSVRTLSCGEIQRVAISRTIVTEPDVLLLDEPTTNLDPVLASKIEEIVSDVTRRETISVIMTAYDMIHGQRLVDSIRVPVNGEIVQSVTAANNDTNCQVKTLLNIVSGQEVNIQVSYAGGFDYTPAFNVQSIPPLLSVWRYPETDWLLDYSSVFFPSQES